MAKVERIDRVAAALRKLADRYKPKTSVIVGFTAEYAVFVHEDTQAYHEPPTCAKFLEKAARVHGKEIGAAVKANLEKGLTMEQALLVGGLTLQREAQKLTPVDTGALRASANTRVETT